MSSFSSRAPGRSLLLPRTRTWRHTEEQSSCQSALPRQTNACPGFGTTPVSEFRFQAFDIKMFSSDILFLVQKAQWGSLFVSWLDQTSLRHIQEVFTDSNQEDRTPRAQISIHCVNGHAAQCQQWVKTSHSISLVASDILHFGSELGSVVLFATGRFNQVI